MRFYTIEKDSRQIVCVGFGEKEIYPVSDFGVNFRDMNSLIDTLTLNECKEIFYAKNGKNPISLDDVKVLAPIPYPKQDILCIGVNYTEHAKESQNFHKEKFHKTQDAIYFCKRTSPANYDGGVIPLHSELTQKIDYECELGVILGKDAKNVTRENAWQYIFGYTIINDISARDVQKGRGQFYFGKSLDGFSPMGPCIVTADEIGENPALSIKCYVNGELRQNSTTDLLIHDIPDILCDLTRGITLRAGTIIATGTPSGVGMGFDPPRFLQSKDKIVCEIEKIGSLTSIMA